MTARVRATHVWPDGATAPVPVDELELDWGGPVGDRHHGETMRSDSRQSSVFPKGTVIRNHRQLSLVSVEELAVIAGAMGLPELAPGLVADNICTEGIPDLTALPRMTRLVFDGGAVVMLGGENMPCTIAGGLVRPSTAPRRRLPEGGHGPRGVTGWVEHPGSCARRGPTRRHALTRPPY